MLRPRRRVKEAEELIMTMEEEKYEGNLEVQNERDSEQQNGRNRESQKIKTRDGKGKRKREKDEMTVQSKSVEKKPKMEESGEAVRDAYQQLQRYLEARRSGNKQEASPKGSQERTPKKKGARDEKEDDERDVITPKEQIKKEEDGKKKMVMEEKKNKKKKKSEGIETKEMKEGNDVRSAKNGAIKKNKDKKEKETKGKMPQTPKRKFNEPEDSTEFSFTPKQDSKIQTPKRKMNKTEDDLQLKFTPKKLNLDEESADKKKNDKKEKKKKGTEHLKEQLKSAQFRDLNEHMYTHTGGDSKKMFDKDPELFDVYHAGFQLQVEKWPENPVDIFIEYLKKKPTHTVIADFGCGDAKIARSLPHKVHSFDFKALNEHVTACDMKKVPLENESVDIGIFSLSLMGTNWVQYVQEAYRVLKPNGVLKVAEVKSRFVDIDEFPKAMKGLGFVVTGQNHLNTMFSLFEFKKIKKTSTQTPTLQLKPCLYKRR